MDGVGTTHSSLQDYVKPLVDLRPKWSPLWACVSTNSHIFFIQFSSCMELDPSAHHRVNCFHRFHLLPSWFASQLSASAPWCHHHSSRSFPIPVENILLDRTLPRWDLLPSTPPGLIGWLLRSNPCCSGSRRPFPTSVSVTVRPVMASTSVPHVLAGGFGVDSPFDQCASRRRSCFRRRSDGKRRFRRPASGRTETDGTRRAIHQRLGGHGGAWRRWKRRTRRDEDPGKRTCGDVCDGWSTRVSEGCDFACTESQRRTKQADLDDVHFATRR